MSAKASVSAFGSSACLAAVSLACAAANASINLFKNQPRLEQVKNIERDLKKGLEVCKDMNLVVDVRVKGALGVIQVKEIRLRPNTGDHDLTTKLTKAQQFLLNGDKLKITVMFRGREMARKEAGLELLERVKDILDEVAKIDKAATLEGRRMSMILSPK